MLALKIGGTKRVSARERQTDREKNKNTNAKRKQEIMKNINKHSSLARNGTSEHCVNFLQQQRKNGNKHLINSNLAHILNINT